jgi:hypothetical protein
MFLIANKGIKKKEELLQKLAKSYARMKHEANSGKHTRETQK